MGYSLDFRKQVFKIKEQENLTFKEASERFGVNIRSLFRWQKCLEPKLKRDKPATKIDMSALALDVEQYPDAYQHERAARLNVSKSCVQAALKRLNISVKKNKSSS